MLMKRVLKNWKIRYTMFSGVPRKTFGKIHSTLPELRKRNTPLQVISLSTLLLPSHFRTAFGYRWCILLSWYEWVQLAWPHLCPSLKSHLLVFQNVQLFFNIVIHHKQPNSILPRRSRRFVQQRYVFYEIDQHNSQALFKKPLHY